jgi:hypothetical protein
MKKRKLSWIAWLACVAASVWLGFEKQWSGVAWAQLGLVLSALPIGWLFYWLPRRHIASLRPSEREQVLAKMSPEQREDILSWLRQHEA